MKTPAPNMDITKIVRQEPRVFIGYYPMRSDQTQWAEEDVLNTAPSVLLMPTQAPVKYMEEERFDRYNGVHRPQQLGQALSIQALFSVYEDGVRMPGFVAKAEDEGFYDMSLIKEGTKEGLFTLLDWMDDFKDALLGQKMIPHTDLFVRESSMSYGLWADQKYINDKRSLFYGFVNVTFQCYAEEKPNEDYQSLLD
ncbi:MAG: hypothetical protein IJ523_10555 [Succinivibrionaceae bacterium]|nr:hypothetical protein [Succinivibrionaceae bacterium]